MRRRIYVTAAIFLLLVALFIPASAESTDSLSNRILSWTGDTGTTVTISWHAVGAADTGSVFYGTDATLTKAKEVQAVQAAETSGIPLDYTIYQATITGLKPNTTYYYAVSNGNIRSGISPFTSGEDETSAFSFLYMGDIHMGVGSAETWGSLLDGAYKRNPGVAFGIFGGDIVDNGINTAEWQSLLDLASPVFSRIPLMPVNGNHESNFPDGKPKLYLDLFDLPQNGPDGFKKEFYSYDYGICHITVLNSWVFSGEQKLSDVDIKKINDWVTEDLASSRATWKIVVMHHPVYSLASDKVADAVRKNWEPLFEQGGVSLVLCGHQHVYSRSYPMTDGKIDYDNGITYVMGNASQKFYSSADETYQAKTLYNVSNNQIVKINGENLTVQSFDAEGNELDFCAIKPRSPSGAQSVFSDVSNDSWFAPAVNYTAERGLMSGTSDGTFSPNLSITRAMTAAVFYRLAGSPGTKSDASGTYSDVPMDAWYGDAVSWLSKNGIMSGYGNGLFGSNDILTREQLAAALYRFALYEKSDMGDPVVLSGFSDASSVSPWAADAVRWAVSAGIIGGAPDGILLPGGTATRAECTQILMKFCLAYAR